MNVSLELCDPSGEIVNSTCLKKEDNFRSVASWGRKIMCNILYVYLMKIPIYEGVLFGIKPKF